MRLSNDHGTIDAISDAAVGYAKVEYLIAAVVSPLRMAKANRLITSLASGPINPPFDWEAAEIRGNDLLEQARRENLTQEEFQKLLFRPRNQ